VSRGLVGARLAIALLLFFVVLAPGVRADRTLSAEEFTRRYAAKFEEVFPGSKATVKAPLEVGIQLSAEAHAEYLTSFLDNAFTQYLAEPARIEEFMDQYIRIAGKVPQMPAAKLEELVPVVRHRSFAGEDKKAKREDDLFSGRQVAGDLFVFYAFDEADSVRYANSAGIEKLGLTEAQRDAVARANLRRIMKEPLINTYPEMVVLSSSDPYLTSVLLIDTFWSPDRFRFRGDLVVFVVARDLILVTGSEERRGLETVRRVAGNAFEELPYTISLEPIVRRNGKWQPFVE
jgi:uncharacterized protein YtpQ (UPF0354 family)